ncbi:hypothetical protein [Chamaesiphon sp.]|uniref:hypothetical protein n=1 Tax=Chamaesiphon sp. TaxID=2814140 RepID=UPI0035942EE0
MISSEIFHQKLQAGQIHQALALLVRDASELDVTTRMTEDTNSQSSSSEYLRTKINLLTGEIQHEVGRDLVTRNSYIKLQQLHIDQIVVSHRLVQGYLDRVKAILTVLDRSQSSQEDALPSDKSIDRLQPSIDVASGSQRLNSADLVARLTQAAMLVDPQLASAPAGSPQEYREELAETPDANPISAGEPQQHPPATNEPSGWTKHQVNLESSFIDDDIDLSIDEDGSVWEEWVEDEDFMSASAIPPSTIPDRQQHWGRHLNPIEVKPTVSRSTTESIDSSGHWDKFVPEYIGISTDPQPPLGNNSNSERMEWLLADLDI